MVALGRDSGILEEKRRLLEPVPSNARHARNFAREQQQQQTAVRTRGASLRVVVCGTVILCLSFFGIFSSTTTPPRPTTPAKASVGDAAVPSTELHDLHLGAPPEAAAGRAGHVRRDKEITETNVRAEGETPREKWLLRPLKTSDHHHNPGETDADPAAAAAAAAAASAPEEEGAEMGAKGRSEGSKESIRTTATATAGVGVGAGVEPPSSDANNKPNVFFIMIDDMGWNDIGYQSTDLEHVTPNLNRLAAGGVKMSHYYSMSICTPARAALMTGRYPLRYGLQYNVIQPGAPWGLPLAEKLFPEYMNDAGYESHMVGKWHLGSYTHWHTPHRRGFETYLGYLNDEEMYWTHQSWTAHMNGHKFFDFGFGNSTGYYDVIERTEMPPGDDDAMSTGPTSSLYSSSLTFKGRYSTEVFTERALDILKEKTPHDEEPLFLYLSHQAVHDPLGIPPSDAFTPEEWTLLDALEDSSGSDLRVRFAKVLMYLDKSIGLLVDYLEAEGWMENSIIVVASDNGGCPGAGGSNYPLRGIKHSYWEGGVKVPAFVYSRSHIPREVRGTEYRGLMHVTDWIPTVAAAAEIELSGSHGDLDGVNHWGHIVAPPAAETAAPSNTSPGTASKDGAEAVDKVRGLHTMGGGLDTVSYDVRSELLYNYDPYVLWAAANNEIGEADYTNAQGAFRQGKWKIMFNAWCSGYYAFGDAISVADKLIVEDKTCQTLGACAECGVSCLNLGVNYTDWLFDMEGDPREEHNLAHLYPEMMGTLRDRALEVVAHEYCNSSYEAIDAVDAYDVWQQNGYWMVPWCNTL
ncbi:unnamed protein product [Pylaiella littoralis]